VLGCQIARVLSMRSKAQCRQMRGNAEGVAGMPGGSNSTAIRQV